MWNNRLVINPPYLSTFLTFFFQMQEKLFSQVNSLATFRPNLTGQPSQGTFSADLLPDMPPISAPRSPVGTPLTSRKRSSPKLIKEITIQVINSSLSFSFRIISFIIQTRILAGKNDDVIIGPRSLR